LKRSLKVDLNDGMPGRNLDGVTKLNLHNNVTDASWMNEVLSYRLFRDAGVPAPRTSYAELFLTVPGKHDHEHVGLYSLVENVDNRFALDRFGTKKGAILKPVTRQPFEDLGEGMGGLPANLRSQDTAFGRRNFPSDFLLQAWCPMRATRSSRRRWPTTLTWTSLPGSWR
jgi:hypothetical protein